MGSRPAGRDAPARRRELRDQLATFWPGAAKVFWSVDSRIALAFLRRYPSPPYARGLGEQRLEAFLKRHGYTGRKPARELLGRLRGGPEGRADELEMQARRQNVLALVSALEPIVQRISELTIEIRHALDAHPDGSTFRSLFIAADSWLCAATMIAEIGDPDRAVADRDPRRAETDADGRDDAAAARVDSLDGCLVDDPDRASTGDRRTRQVDRGEIATRTGGQLSNHAIRRVDEPERAIRARHPYSVLRGREPAGASLVQIVRTT